jgi:integrase/recombinase XerD
MSNEGGILVPRAGLAAMTLAALAAIPEEQLWLEEQRSPATRIAYGRDVVRFMRFLGMRGPEELRLASRGAVIAYVRDMQASGSKPSTVNRALAALTSLYSHLVRRQVIRENPCREVKRLYLGQRHGVTPAFSAAQARALLDAPARGSLQGIRDRAILSVGLQAGLRRGGIVSLRVCGFYQDRGFDCLRFTLKGGGEHVTAIHPQTTQRIHEYLDASGPLLDRNGPLFRPVRTRPDLPTQRHLQGATVNTIVRRCARLAGIQGHFTAHSMRATFITTALENGAPLDAVQRAVGHACPTTTQLCDRRPYHPSRSAAFYANY